MGVGTKILLIESDEKEVVKFERLVSELDFPCLLYSSSTIDDGLVFVTEKKIDLIFLDDYKYQEINSSHVREFKTIQGKSSVIVTSGEFNSQRAKELIGEGVGDYILKSSLSKKVLEQIISRIFKLTSLKVDESKTQEKKSINNNQLELIFSKASIAMLVLDEKGVFQLELGNLKESLNPQKGSFIGKAFSDSFSAYPDLVEAYKKSCSEGEQSAKFSSGSSVFEVTFSPTFSTDDKLVELYVLFNDITSFNQENQSLIKENKRLKKSSQTKQDFIANMSHEIRTPMNAMIGFSNLLSETNLDELQNDFVQSIKTSGENLLSLVNDILDSSKIEAGKLKIEKEGFNIRKVVKSVFDLLHAKATNKNNSLNYIIHNNIPEILVGDQTRVYQVLMNLIDNAIKFTNSGKIELEIVTLKEKSNSVDLLFKIKDTGVGIPIQKHSEIFKSFVQVKEGSTAKEGSGLGLAIVKKIIDLMAGEISVDSEEGLGSTFKVLLPFEITNNKNSSVSLPKNLLNKLKGKKLLLAEDNQMNQNLIIMYFKNYDVHIDIANNGNEAIKAAKENEYDLVLMDVQMPQCDGLEATKQIRALDSDKSKVPIVAMTAYAFTEDIDNCLSIGMNAHVSKPIEKEAFLNLIGSLLQENKSAEIKLSKIESGGNIKAPADLGYLIDVCDGNIGFINEMIQIFKTESPLMIEKMRNAFTKNNWVTLSKVAHKYRSSCVIMGMNNIAKIAESIEYHDYQIKGGLSDVEEGIKLIDEQSDLAINYIQKNFG